MVGAVRSMGLLWKSTRLSWGGVAPAGGIAGKEKDVGQGAVQVGCFPWVGQRDTSSKALTPSLAMMGRFWFGFFLLLICT